MALSFTDLPILKLGTGSASARGVQYLAVPRDLDFSNLTLELTDHDLWWVADNNIECSTGKVNDRDQLIISTERAIIPAGTIIYCNLSRPSIWTTSDTLYATMEYFCCSLALNPSRNEEPHSMSYFKGGNYAGTVGEDEDTWWGIELNVQQFRQSTRTGIFRA